MASKRGKKMKWKWYHAALLAGGGVGAYYLLTMRREEEEVFAAVVVTPPLAPPPEPRILVTPAPSGVDPALHKAAVLDKFTVDTLNWVEYYDNYASDLRNRQKDVLRSGPSLEQLVDLRQGWEEYAANVDEFEARIRSSTLIAEAPQAAQAVESLARDAHAEVDAKIAELEDAAERIFKVRGSLAQGRSRIFETE